MGPGETLPADSRSTETIVIRSERQESMTNDLDQTALNWNQLSADNLIYFIELEQLIRVRSNADRGRRCL